MMKWLDLPPVWLVVFLALARVQSRNLPLGPPGGAIMDLAGGLLVGAGILIAILAIRGLFSAKTTVHPHGAPSQLVETGIYRFSRNPIYLADALILSGLILFWSAWPSLLLIPLFVWLITDRFILAEEARLQAAFGDQFETYRSRVRRWF